MVFKTDVVMEWLLGNFGWLIPIIILLTGLLPVYFSGVNWNVMSPILVSVLVGLNQYFNKYFFQTRKNVLDKDLEAYRHRLQIEIAKAEVKTKQLSTIYPEIFMKLKEAEASVFILRGPVKLKRPIDERDEKKVETDIINANYMVCMNLLYLSESTEKLCLNSLELMRECLYKTKSGEESPSCSKMQSSVNAVKEQMRKELCDDIRL